MHLESVVERREGEMHLSIVIRLSKIVLLSGVIILERYKKEFFQEIIKQNIWHETRLEITCASLLWRHENAGYFKVSFRKETAKVAFDIEIYIYRTVKLMSV